ncbi:MAG: nitroreductase [Ruminococcus sp.]|nr:nitroreductase [Ruminococcus sp.]
MSEVMDKIVTRRSVRAFTDEMPTDEQLEEIIKAGTYAATGMNRQSPIIIAVTNKELRDKLAVMNAGFMGKGADFDPFYGAPVVLIVLADKSAPTYIYDGSLVMGNLMLAAHDQGLGSCWIHRAREEFETEEGKEILRSLGIEGDYEGIGHCVIGCPKDEQPADKPRKENWVYYIK